MPPTSSFTCCIFCIFNPRENFLFFFTLQYFVNFHQNWMKMCINFFAWKNWIRLSLKQLIQMSSLQLFPQYYLLGNQQKDLNTIHFIYVLKLCLKLNGLFSLDSSFTHCWEHSCSVRESPEVLGARKKSLCTDGLQSQIPEVWKTVKQGWKPTDKPLICLKNKKE